MLLIFSKVLVVFIYIGIGLAANKLGVLPKGSVKPFTGLIMQITLPCLMISSITGHELDDSMLRNTVITLVLTSLIYVIVAVLTTFFSDRAFTGKEQPDRNVLASSMTGCNSGFMGFPVAKSVFGPLAFYYMVIQNISNNLYLFMMSLVQLHHREASSAARKSLKEMLRPMANVTGAATVISIVMLFTGIHLPAYVMEIIEPIGDITIPLSMIIVGVQLSGTDIRRLVSDRYIMTASAIKLIVVPALVVLITIPLPVDPIVKLTALLGMSFPSSVMGVAVSAQEKLNSELMAEVVASTTLLSLITLPIWIMVMSRLYL